MPSLDSVLPGSGGGGAQGGGGSGVSATASGCSAAAAAPLPPPPARSPTPPPASAALLTKPPLPPTAAEKILSSVPLGAAAKQRALPPPPKQKGGSSAAASPLPPADASLKEVAPAAPPQMPKLTGMAAFDAADRYSFDVAGTGLGSPARPPGAPLAVVGKGEGGRNDGDGDVAAASAAATSTPRPAAPPPAQLRSSLDAPVSQRHSMESAGSAGRAGGGNAGGGGYTGGGASVASSTARSARSSFALEAADRPTAAEAARGASPPPAFSSISSAAAPAYGTGGSDELYPQAGLNVDESSSSAAAAAAAAAAAWLPPLEASAAFLPSLPSHLVARASSLALVPPDTPLPTSLLWRLWGLNKKKKHGEGEEEGEPEAAARLAAAATAIADELASPEAGSMMKVARLADGSAWALTRPDVHAALVQARLGGPAAEHRELLSAYCETQGSGGDRESPFSLACALLPTSTTVDASRLASMLALASDDGYLMHNVGHHLAAAGALPALASLLGDVAWLDAKLRSYGAATVTADFRRALALAQQEEQREKQQGQQQQGQQQQQHKEEGGEGAERARSPPPAPPPPCLVSPAERIRLLLAAFQMSAPAAVACPAARGVLGSQMSSRLLAADRALCPHLSRDRAPSALSPSLLLSKATAERDRPNSDEDVEEEGDSSAAAPAAKGFRTTTPSLQQAGGAARLVLRGHTSPVLRVIIAPNGVDVIAVAADGAVRVFDLEVGDCVLHVPAISLPPPPPPPPPPPAAAATDDAKAWSSSPPSSPLSAFHLPSSSSSAAAAAAASSPAAFSVTPAAAAATNPRLRDGNAVDASLDGSGRLLLTACADGVARVWDLAATTATTTAGGAAAGGSSACLVRELDGGPRAAPLHAAALCSSGRTAATAGSDGLLRLWDVEAGACVAALSAHSGAGVRALALSADGGVALTGGEDFGAVAWDVRRLRPTAVLAGHSGWVVSVALVPSPSSPPGGAIRRALTASHDGTARVWELRSGACAHVLEGHGGRLSAVHASADGRRALTASDDGTARLWDLDCGACLCVMDPGRATEVGGGALRSSSVPPGGGWIADAVLGGGGRSPRAPSDAADADDAEVKNQTPSALFPSSIVAAACGDGHVAAFDAATGSLLALLPGHAGPALCVAATRRGRFVITGGADGTARVWDLASPLLGKERRNASSSSAAASALLARKHGGRVCCIAVSEAGGTEAEETSSASTPLPLVVTVGDDGALAWSPSGLPLPPLRGGGVPTRWARASPDGRAITVASPDGGLRAWRAAVPVSSSAAAAAAGLPPTQRREGQDTRPTLEPGVAGAPGSRVRAFDAAPTAWVALLATYDSAVKVVRYGKNGDGGPTPSSAAPSAFFLQSRGGGPGTGPGSAPGERGHPGVGHARLSADGLVAATASVDGSARLWCARSGRRLAELVPLQGSASGLPPPVVATSLSLDGHTLLVVGADGSANAWDLSAAVESAKKNDGASGLSFTPRVLAVAGSGTVGGRLSPDGSRALLWCGSSGNSGTSPATVWLLKDDFSSSSMSASPLLIAHLESPTGGVSATSWSCDGKSAALGSADGTLRVVCTEFGRTKGFFMADAGVTAVAFCSKAVVVGCDDGSVHFAALE